MKVHCTCSGRFQEGYWGPLTFFHTLLIFRKNNLIIYYKMFFFFFTFWCEKSNCAVQEWGRLGMATQHLLSGFHGKHHSAKLYIVNSRSIKYFKYLYHIFGIGFQFRNYEYNFLIIILYLSSGISSRT